MRRLPDSERLEHKFLVRANQEQYDAVMAEAEARGVAPTIIAREFFRRGLEVLHEDPEPAPIVKAVHPSPRPQTPQAAGTGKAAALIRQRQAEHDELCLPHLRAASGPKDAIQRLEVAGIPMPSGKGIWRKEAVWQICRRHGISYLLSSGRP